MKHITLHRLLVQAPRAVLAAALVMAAGCYGGVDVSSFDSPLCNNGFPSVDGLRPAMPVDFIELADGHSDILSSTGTKCLTAVNQAACITAVDNVPFSTIIPGFAAINSVEPAGLFVVTTTGDSVKLITTKAQLDAFLAPYDTEQAAVLAALSFGLSENILQIDCTDKTKGSVRKIDGGYEVVGITTEGCQNWSIVQHLLFVTPDGTVTERFRYTLASGTAEACVV